MGSKEATTGGESLTHYASLRIRMTRTQLVAPKKKETEEFEWGSQSNVKFTSAQTQFYIVKSKVSNPFVTAVVSHVYGQGFDVVGDMYLNCKDDPKTQRVKGQYILDIPDHQLAFADEPAFRELLASNPGLKDKVYDYILGPNKAKTTQGVITVDDPGDRFEEEVISDTPSDDSELSVD